MDYDSRSPGPAPEVVFVLRLRWGADGWWGQVHQVGTEQAVNVAGSRQLYGFLDSCWQQDAATESRSEPEGGVV